MATPANAVDTVQTVGKKEDVLDVIYNIDPYDTPFMSSIGKGSAHNIIFQWQTDELRAPGDNARIEGEDATIRPGSFTTLLDNYMQISDETLQVTGTTDAVSHYGRAKESKYQWAKKAKELKLDMERTLITVEQAKVQRNGSTPGRLANVYAYYKTNGSVGASTGVQPTGDGSDVHTAGTLRTLTETLVTDAAENIWTNGGKANVIMVNGPMKQYISNTFRGRTDEIKQNVSDRKAQAVVDFYESDFGLYKIVANRWMKSDALFMYDPSMHSLVYLRPFRTYPLSKTGDSEKWQMLTEWSLRVNNEKSGAVIHDLQLS
jgi:hypothetical protein